MGQYQEREGRKERSHFFSFLPKHLCGPQSSSRSLCREKIKVTSGYESRYELKRSANTWTRSPVAVTNKMLSFELGKEIKERYFSSCHEHRTKKKIWVLMRNQTSDLWIPRSDALPLSHRVFHIFLFQVNGGESWNYIICLINLNIKRMKWFHSNLL